MFLANHRGKAVPEICGRPGMPGGQGRMRQRLVQKTNFRKLKVQRLVEREAKRLCVIMPGDETAVPGSRIRKAAEA